MNITLIGMPGVGKSTVGKSLANRLGYRFLDTDHLFIEKHQMPLQAFIEKHGNDAFIAAEDALILGLPPLTHTVLSPGGSVIYADGAMRHLKSISTVIYLYDHISRIQRRIHNLNQRGIVGLNGRSLKALYAERRPLYERYADITISVVGVRKAAQTIGTLLIAVEKKTHISLLNEQ